MATEEENVSAVHPVVPPAEAQPPAKELLLVDLVPPEQSAFNLVFAEVFGSPPEFSARYCEICGDTTPHARLRGKFNKEVKIIPWLCTPCLLPGGALHKIVNGLMTRQGENVK